MAWQTPNLGWIDGGRGPAASDMNRIEGNPDYLKTALEDEATTRAANDTTETNGRIAADAAEVTARNAAILVETNDRIAADAAEASARGTADLEYYGSLPAAGVSSYRRFGVSGLPDIHLYFCTRTGSYPNYVYQWTQLL